MGDIPFFPQSASTVSGDVDALFCTLIGLSALFIIPIVCVILFFGVKYRRGAQANRSGQIPYQWLLETTWIVIPLGLALSVFVWVFLFPLLYLAR